jgi:hypothetical protein
MNLFLWLSGNYFVPEPVPLRACAGSNWRVFRMVDRDVLIAISPVKNRAEPESIAADGDGP